MAPEVVTPPVATRAIPVAARGAFRGSTGKTDTLPDATRFRI